MLRLKLFETLTGIITLGLIASGVLAADYPESVVHKQLGEIKNSISLNPTTMVPGELRTIDYVGREILVYRRNVKDMDALAESGVSHLADPHSQNMYAALNKEFGSSVSEVWARLLHVNQPELEEAQYRSRNKEFLVAGNWSPNSGCVLVHYGVEDRNHGNPKFFDPCTGAGYDAAGRVLLQQDRGHAKEFPAIYNLSIPPHYFKSAQELVIGLEQGAQLPELNVDLELKFASLKPTAKLVEAAFHNDIKNVKSALAMGADIENTQKPWRKPLLAAIIGASTEIVQLLIDSGVKINHAAIQHAIRLDRWDVVSLLVERPTPVE